MPGLRLSRQKVLGEVTRETDLRRGKGSQQVLRNMLLGPSAEETSQALPEGWCGPSADHSLEEAVG